jgi:SAM-dependent methyltransferase
VGGGRQAIAFHLLGAKKVYHYDIGPKNVERLGKYIKANVIQNKIVTECVDLVSYSPPQDRFDLVYLHGIAHHFSHTGIGLINCMRSLKKGGYLWFYFYRSGAFHHFVVQMLRDLINLADINIKEWYIKAVIGFSADCKLNHAVDQVLFTLEKL